MADASGYQTGECVGYHVCKGNCCEARRLWVGREIAGEIRRAERRLNWWIRSYLLRGLQMVCHHVLLEIAVSPTDHWYSHLRYRAPEMLGQGNDYGPPADIWSLGCTISEFITISPLFQVLHYISVIDVVDIGMLLS